MRGIFSVEDLFSWLRKKKDKDKKKKGKRKVTAIYYVPPAVARTYYLMYMLGEIMKNERGVPKELYEHMLKTLKSHINLWPNRKFMKQAFEKIAEGALPEHIIADVYHSVYPLPEDLYRRLKEIYPYSDPTDKRPFEEDIKTLEEFAKYVEEHENEYRGVLGKMFDIEYLDKLSDEQKRRIVVGIPHDLVKVARDPRVYFGTYPFLEVMKIVEPFDRHIAKSVAEGKHKGVIEKLIERDTSKMLYRSYQLANTLSPPSFETLELENVAAALSPPLHEEAAKHSPFVESIFPFLILEKNNVLRVEEGEKLLKKYRDGWYHVKTAKGEKIPVEHGGLVRELLNMRLLRTLKETMKMPETISIISKDFEERMHKAEEILQDGLRYAKEDVVPHEIHQNIIDRLHELSKVKRYVREK